MIDAHAHVVTTDFSRYPTRSDIDEVTFDKARSGEFTGANLLAAMDESGVEHVILLQRNSIHGTDHRYLLDVAASDPARISPVAAVDAARVTAGELAALVDRGVRGFRISALISGLASDRDPLYSGWLDSPEAIRVWDAAAAQDLPICVHFTRENRVAGLVALGDLAHRFAEVDILVDHVASSAIESGPPEYGLSELVTAAFPNVTVKVTPQNFESVEAAGLSTPEFVRRLVDVFGSERLVFGSDVTNTAGTYGELFDRGRDAALLLTDVERENLFGLTVAKVYALNQRG